MVVHLVSKEHFVKKPVALAPLDWIVPTHVTRTVKEMNRVSLSPEFVIKVAKKDGVV